MLNYIVRLALVGLVVYMIPDVLSQIQVSSLTSAIIVAFVMSLLNTFVKPILTILSLPITILTLGLFYFVVTVAIVYLCDALVGGFKVDGFLQPLIFSFILSIVNSLVGSFQE
ncbi:phage holin family protein [Jiulongibacter sediminis]|jgi:putative membrane protein|uniref:phage holin family protein n=1 Tax=Jiulongibacter sediminis TaxID=1605367 RepID=UPI0026F11E1C|nr:phage holin family protein [Jiulongibacter sediminis]